jgi:hypothetical protein
MLLATCAALCKYGQFAQRGADPWKHLKQCGTGWLPTRGPEGSCQSSAQGTSLVGRWGSRRAPFVLAYRPLHRLQKEANSQAIGSQCCPLQRHETAPGHGQPTAVRHR